MNRTVNAQLVERVLEAGDAYHHAALAGGANTDRLRREYQQARGKLARALAPDDGGTLATLEALTRPAGLTVELPRAEVLAGLPIALKLDLSDAPVGRAVNALRACADGLEQAMLGRDPTTQRQRALDAVGDLVYRLLPAEARPDAGAIAERIIARLEELGQYPPPREQRDVVLFVFDGPPGPEGPRFVETERPDGCGVGVGEWVELAGGRWALEVPVPADEVRDV